MTEATSSSAAPLDPVEHQHDASVVDDGSDGVVGTAAAAAGTSSRRSEPKGPPSACLFVASLSGETTEDTLAAFFSQHGQVLKIKLLKDRSSRPYAFVQYQVRSAASLSCGACACLLSLSPFSLCLLFVCSYIWAECSCAVYFTVSVIRDGAGGVVLVLELCFVVVSSVLFPAVCARYGGGGEVVGRCRRRRRCCSSFKCLPCVLVLLLVLVW